MVHNRSIALLSINLAYDVYVDIYYNAIMDPNSIISYCLLTYQAYHMNIWTNNYYWQKSDAEHFWGKIVTDESSFIWTYNLFLWNFQSAVFPE